MSPVRSNECVGMELPRVGNPRTVRDLAALVQSYNPKLVFLSETRQSEERMQSLRWRLGLKGCLARRCVGRSGGIALFWDESLAVNLITISNKVIDVSVQEDPTSPPWRISFFYGEPRVVDRYLTWEFMKRIKSRSDKPWIMMGDFNETMWQFEHFSSTKRGERQMEAYREALEFCGMHDLGFVGLPWTFDNKQFGRRNVRVRLDRAVADDNWSNLFDQASVEHLVSPCSDHCPILLRLAPADAQRVKPKILRYEIMWEREQSLGDVIMEAWDSGPTKTSLASFASALKGVMQSLHSWSRENFGSVRRKLEELRTRLAELNGKMDDDSRAEARRTAAVMDEMLYREEMMWLQCPVFHGCGREIETLSSSTKKLSGGRGKIESKD